MFMLKSQSRNSYNNLWRIERVRENFRSQLNVRLPHADAVEDILRELAPSELENVKKQLVKNLVGQQLLRKYRMSGKYYLIAVDATGIATFHQRHCEHCLTRTSKNGSVTYFHYVLEAKMVSSDGLSISLASEFVENPSDQKFDKQDCELKAFKRLAQKIKTDFPRLPICILADGLYPNQSVFEICKQNQWKFIITLKDNSLKTFQEEAGLLSCTAKTREVSRQEGGCRIDSRYAFLNGVEYNGAYYSWLSCTETCMGHNVKKEKTKNVTRFVYITNIEQSFDNLILTVESARLRWKVENEGFNTQKNLGYGLEHKYSRSSYNAMQNYYQMLQIAHMINFFVESHNTTIELMGEHSKTTVANLWDNLKAYLRFISHSPLLYHRLE